jgi:hypothetical protein
MVFVSWKVNIIEGWYQDHNCLFRQEFQTQKPTLGLSPSEHVFCALETDDGRST